MAHTVFRFAMCLGCHFHFGQCQWRFVVEHGYKKEFSAVGNEDLQDFIHTAIAMAFVPLERLIEGFCHLIDVGYNLQDQFVEFADEYLEYFYDTWINGHFPPKMWNYYQFEGRTNNNYLEVILLHFCWGFHGSLFTCFEYFK